MAALVAVGALAAAAPASGAISLGSAHGPAVSDGAGTIALVPAGGTIRS